MDVRVITVELLFLIIAVALLTMIGDMWLHIFGLAHDSL